MHRILSRSFENKRENWVEMDIGKCAAPQYFQRAASGLTVSFAKIIIAFLIAVILAQIQRHRVLAIWSKCTYRLCIAREHMFNRHVTTEIRAGFSVSYIRSWDCCRISKRSWLYTCFSVSLYCKISDVELAFGCSSAKCQKIQSYMYIWKSFFPCFFIIFRVIALDASMCICPGCYPWLQILIPF